MAKKAKKKMHRMPPLSFVDKMIYWTCLILLCVGYLCLLFGSFYLQNRIAFADKTVVATREHISVLWLLVPWLTFFCITFALWISAYENRKPIFGRRNFKYGPPAWPKKYPLFMKNKPDVFVSKRDREFRRKATMILLVILLVSFIPFPWSLYGRDSLCIDGSIQQYSMFNRQKKSFSSEEYTSVKIETYRRRSRRGMNGVYSVQMVFTTDRGRRYIFEARDFRSDNPNSRQEWVEEMTQVKHRLNPDVICYDGIERLEWVVESRNLNVIETKMLYQLFNQEITE